MFLATDRLAIKMNQMWPLLLCESELIALILKLNAAIMQL